MLLSFSMLKLSGEVRVATVAARQQGRVAWWQLRELDVPEGTISLWVRQGCLHRRLPHVYAVGHAATSSEAALVEALLYAGPGAMLSHATAAWWLGLLDTRAKTIHVSTPRRCAGVIEGHQDSPTAHARTRLAQPPPRHHPPSDHR